MNKFLDYIIQSVKDGDGAISSMRIIYMFGSILTICTYLLLLFVYSVQKGQLIETPSGTSTTLIGILTALNVGKVGQTFGEKN